MTELDQLLSEAFATQGKQEAVNKVYLSLLRSPLFIPVEKASLVVTPDPEEPFKPLFANVGDKIFMLAFDTLERLTAWAGEHYDQLEYVEISGRDIVAGMGTTVFLGLNLGTEFYKEFAPDEIKHLKKVVARIDQLRMQGG